MEGAVNTWRRLKQGSNDTAWGYSPEGSNDTVGGE